MTLYRQGDVLIIAIKQIPATTRPVVQDNGRVILACGELTGHAHAVIGDAELFESDVSEIGQRFLRVEQESEVVHEEHGTVTLPPGDYEIRRQHEYSPEAIRTRAGTQATGSPTGCLPAA